MKRRDAIELSCGGNLPISVLLARMRAVGMGVEIMRLEIYLEHFLQCYKHKELK